MNELEHKEALRRIEKAMDTESFDAEINLLVDAVHEYESELYPRTLPDPIEAIKFRIEQAGHSQTEVSRCVGIARSHLSEVLNRKRKLSLDMVRGFHRYGISLETLVQDYDL